MREKKLFVPLKTEYYEAFEGGIKRKEYRLYGKVWNEKNCRVGKQAVLSKGYGKKNRLNAVVVGFEVMELKELRKLNPAAAVSMASIYPKAPPEQLIAITEFDL